jgi:hypothetical protein
VQGKSGEFDVAGDNEAENFAAKKVAEIAIR